MTVIATLQLLKHLHLVATFAWRNVMTTPTIHQALEIERAWKYIIIAM
jgi:hypothetical protein